MLDVACGPGYAAAAGSARGAVAIGVDFSSEMVEEARGRYPGIEFREGDAEQLSFPDSTFDAVVLNFGMLHLGRPEQALREAHRVLQPGGRIAFTVWDMPNRAIGFGIVLAAIQKYGDLNVPIPPGPPFFKYSSREQGIGLLTAAGFASPKAHLTHLTWRLPNADSLFEAFYEGTARTGGNLRAQPEENRERIRRAVREDVARYERAGSVELPMAAWVYLGHKSAPKAAGHSSSE